MLAYFKEAAMSEQATNLKLVQEVERHPCLYNYKLPQYSRKDITDRAWSEVGKAVNLTESLAKEKWRNLRTVFSRYLRPAPSGSAKIKKPYYLADVMQFAIPFIKGSIPAASGNLESFATQNVDELSPVFTQGVLPHEFLSTETSAALQSTQDVLPHEFLATETSAPLQSTQQSPVPSPNTTPPVRKRKSMSTLSAVDNSFMQYFEAKRAKLQGLPTSKTPMEMFLLSLLPEIEEMNENQKIIFKRRILALIDDIVRPGVIPVPPPSYTITTQNPTLYRSARNSNNTEKTDCYDFAEETIIDNVAAYQVYDDSDECTFIPE